MSERKHADLWRELVDEAAEHEAGEHDGGEHETGEDEAGEDEIERAASVSVAEAEAELKAAGFDVAAERAKASAFVDALQSEVSSPASKEAATHAREPMHAPEATRVPAAPHRKGPRAAVVWLAAAASLVVAAGALYALYPSSDLVSTPPPPRRTPGVPSADELEVAALLRRKAADACEAKQWDTCLADLDEARTLDPDGDQASTVKTLREKATAGGQEKR